MAEQPPLHIRIQNDLTAARRVQDKDAVLLLGMVLSDIQNVELSRNDALTDDDIIDVIRKGIKRRRESQKMYETGGREELAAKEGAEAEKLGEYLPPAVDDAELREAVRAAIAAGASGIGEVMGRVMPKFKGRVEGGRINAIAREELAGK